MLKKLEHPLEELRQVMDQYQITNLKVSKASIGWHTEHALLTIDRIIENLVQSDKKNYQWKPNFSKWFVFYTYTIPRGVAKSPRSVRPEHNLSREELENHIQHTKRKLIQLENAEKRQFFEHPNFGHLKKKETLYFLGLHTHHHIKIIRDILKTKS